MRAVQTFFDPPSSEAGNNAKQRTEVDIAPFEPMDGTALYLLRRRLRPYVKRAIDIIGSLLLIIILAPILLLIIVAVRLDGGTAFYRHTRIGSGGKPFKCIKFRSMVVNADRVLADLLERDPAARIEWTANLKLRRDPRVTRIGAILRASSLDELPQLFNVLAGSMSLVGPRPVTGGELQDFYRDSAAIYLSVRPGLTGLWQVSGRSSTTYAERVALDVAYTQNPSIRRDVQILLRTVVVVVNRSGAY